MASSGSFGLILAIAGVAIAGVAAGFILPSTPLEEWSTAAGAISPDSEIGRLHEGCMTGPLRRGSFPDFVQKQYCDCQVEGALNSLTSRQIDLVTTVFEQGPAALTKKVAALSQSEAAEVKQRMSILYELEQRCRKRLYDVVIALPSSQNEQSIRNDPRFTRFYDGCVLGHDSHEKSPLDVQRAFCECYGREAAIHLRTTEIQALTVAFHQGPAALKRYVEALPQTEQAGFSKRVGRFNESAHGKCLQRARGVAEAG